MPGYNQNVADLQKSVLVDSISLTSANGLLSVQVRSTMVSVRSLSDSPIQSVACEAGQFSSLNGDIDGHFTAQSSLNLNTVNGRIVPTVNLLHRESGDPPKLTIHSVNGYAIFIL